MKNISYYNPPISNIKPAKAISIKELIELIRGEKFKEVTEKLRSLDSNERAEFKKQNLPGVTISGEFSIRNDKGLIHHSDGIVADVDNLESNFLKKAIFYLKLIGNDTPIIASFISPSGNGLKIIVKVDSKKLTQKENFDAVIKYLKVSLHIEEKNFDRSCSNVSRLCFLCHDDKIWVNKNFEKDDSKINALDAEKWLHFREKKSIGYFENEIPVSLVEKEQMSKKIVDVAKDDIIYLENSKLDFDHKNQQSNFLKLLVMTLNKAGKFQKGNRHNFIQIFSSNANHFGISQNELIEYCNDYFSNHSEIKNEDFPFDVDKELIPIIKDTYNRYKHQFGSWKPDEVIEEFETPSISQTVYESLPPFLKSMCLSFDGERERDVFFLGTLGVLSTCFPRVQGFYDQKILGMNLFLFISAPASAGKGNLYWSRKLANPVINLVREKYQIEMHDYEEAMKNYESAKGEERGQKPIKPLKKKFIIPGNSSTASIISCMHGNQFYGLIFETEADTLSNTLKKEWGDFSDTIRKAFHHEPIQLLRRTNDEDIEVDKSYLSMVLSGTPAQIDILLNSVENGFFSRFLFYDFPQNIVWKNVFEKNGISIEAFFNSMSTKLFSYSLPFFEKVDDDFSNQILFELTEDQQRKFNSWFENKLIQLHHMYGDDIVASIKRLAVCFFRIAMILSTIRYVEMKIDSGKGGIGKSIICEDVDYENTEKIISTLLYHTVKVFRQVKKYKKNKYSIGIKDLFFKQLPNEFNRTIAMETANLLGIKEKTAEKYLSDLIESNKILKPRHNQYEKPLS